MKKTETGYELDYTHKCLFGCLDSIWNRSGMQAFGLISALNVAKAEFLYNSIMFGIAVFYFFGRDMLLKITVSMIRILY